MSKPKISVLVPTYKPNREHLRESLQCLMDQTETDWYCVIRDEPTEVDTQSFIADFLEDDRFEYFRNDECLGIGGNWNACLKHAKAPYVAYLFQDDLWHKEYLAKGIQMLEENPSVGFVSIDHAYQYEGTVDTIPAYEELLMFKRSQVDGGFHNGHEILNWWIEHELHPNIIGEPPFVIFRKETLDEVGPFNEVMPQFLDSEYWIRCLLKTDWYYLKEEVGAFRVHPEAASAQNRAAGRGILDRFQCFQQLIANLPGGKLKQKTIAARNHAFKSMVRKYLDRKKLGQNVNLNKAGVSTAELKKFALAHPVLTIKSIWSARN